jgi:hypothetical protein
LDAFVLIDYDNLSEAARRPGLVTLARRIDASISGVVQDLADTHIRLYGGWYDEIGLTNAGTLLTQEIGSSFPISLALGGRMARRIKCEIASSLIDSRGDVFLFTMRRRRGMRSVLKSQKSQNCANPGSCTIDAVRQWSQGPCPATGCAVASPHVFTYNEQKLTDTLLCADILALAQRAPAPPTFVLSNDDDMTPPILLAAKSGAPICHIRSSPNAKFYDGILRRNNVQILVL